MHKTLHFIHRKDPEESSRKVAGEGYKSVRRESHSSEDDPIKGLLLAFWWLRLAQRKAMKLSVDPTAATRTRRDELRYADRVNVVHELILIK